MAPDPTARVSGDSGQGRRPWYGVVIVPPRSIVNRIRRLQARVGVERAEHQPHVTLKMPFWARCPIKEVEARIARAVEGFSPLEVVIEGVGSFSGPYSYAIYASLAGERGLESLHERLVRDLGDAIENVYPYTDEIEQTSYVPHITIAADLTEADFNRVLDELERVKLAGTFVAEHVDLMRRQSDGRWRTVRVFPLTRPTPETAHETAPRRNY